MITNSGYKVVNHPKIILIKHNNRQQLKEIGLDQTLTSKAKCSQLLSFELRPQPLPLATPQIDEQLWTIFEFRKGKIKKTSLTYKGKKIKRNKNYSNILYKRTKI